jgi:hypothetical protein
MVLGEGIFTQVKNTQHIPQEENISGRGNISPNLINTTEIPLKRIVVELGIFLPVITLHVPQKENYSGRKNISPSQYTRCIPPVRE